MRQATELRRSPPRPARARDPALDRPGELLLAPSFITAVAVLLLNDHLLKALYPGWLTGKLSDVAGLYFFPLLVVSLLELCWPNTLRQRPRLLLLSGACSALAFALIKTWPPATELYEVTFGAIRSLVAAWLWPGSPPIARVTVAPDPSDLLALPACFVHALGRQFPRRAAPRRATSRSHPSTERPESQRRSCSSTSK